VHALSGAIQLERRSNGFGFPKLKREPAKLLLLAANLVVCCANRDRRPALRKKCATSDKDLQDMKQSGPFLRQPNP